MSDIYDSQTDYISVASAAKINALTAAVGRIEGVGLYPIVFGNYTFFKVGTTYYRHNNVTGEVDDSNADASTLIQTAIDGMTDGNLHIKGILGCTSNITIDSKRIGVSGDGMESSKLSFSGDIHGLRIVSTGQLSIRNLALIGDNSLTNRGLDVQDSNNVHVNNVLIDYWKDDAGLYLYDIIDCVFTNVYAQRNNQGLLFYDVCNNNIFIGCRFKDNTVEGVEVNTATNNGNTLLGCDIDGNLRGLLVSNGVTKLTIKDCWFESNTQYGVKTDSAGENYNYGVKIEDCFFTTSGEDQPNHILLEYARKAVVDHCFINEGGVGITVYATSNDTTLSNMIFDEDNPPTTKITDLGVDTKYFANLGYTTDNSGTSTGTGSQQTIAHGLDVTPDRVMFGDLEEGANAYQSAAADATNIYITAVSGKDYVWRAWLA